VETPRSDIFKKKNFIIKNRRLFNMDADIRKNSNSKIKAITLSGPSKTLNHQKSAPAITRPKSGSNKENMNPVTTDVESSLNDNGNTTRKSPKHKKERKQKKLARELSKNVIVPFVAENTDVKKKSSVEETQRETSPNTTTARNRSMSDPKKLHSRRIESENPAKSKTRPQKLEKQTSASELLRSVAAGRVLKRRKTVNTNEPVHGKKKSLSMHFNYRVKMEFILEEINSLTMVNYNTKISRLYYYYTWQVDRIIGHSNFFQTEDGTIKWNKREGFIFKTVFLGNIDRKVIAPKLLKISVKQHLGNFNNGNPVVTDRDISIAEFSFNISPFVSTSTEDVFYDSPKLQQKGNANSQELPYIMFTVKSKRSSHTVFNEPNSFQAASPPAEPSNPDIRNSKKIPFPRQGSKPSFRPMNRSKTDNTIEDTLVLDLTLSQEKSHTTNSVSMNNHNLNTSSQNNIYSSIYTKHVEEKCQILEMKISQVVQQNHTTHSMYEELFTEVEEYRRVRVKSHNPGNNINELGVQLKDFFPGRRELQNINRDEDKSVEEVKKRNDEREESESTENGKYYKLRESYCNLQRDYNRLKEEKEKLSRLLSNCTEENRQLQLQNQELNTQLLAVLNEHYKMISRQLSESPSARSLAELKSQLSDSSVTSEMDVNSSDKSLLETQPFGQTHEKNTSHTASKSVKETVVNLSAVPSIKDSSNRISTSASLSTLPCEKDNGKRRCSSFGKSKRSGKYDPLLSAVGELSET